MTFAEAVRSARVKAGMTQEELATAIGVSRRTINAYENGKSWPKNHNRYKQLARSLGVTVSSLTLVEEKYSDMSGGNDDADKQKRITENLNNFHTIFAGGELSEEDLDRYMQALQEIYWGLKRTIKDKRIKETSDDASDRGI